MRHLKLAFAFAVSCLAISATAANAGTIIVDPANPDGWAFSNTDNSGTNASGGYFAGPATPPLGVGSANFIVGDTTSSEILEKSLGGSIPLSSFNTLKYSTYVTTSTLGSGSAPTLQFDLFDGATYMGRLVFDPGLLLTVADGSWQSWNGVTQDAWYLTHSSSQFGGQCSIAGSGGSYCSFSQVTALLNADSADAVDELFKAGSGQASFNGNVDDFQIGNSDILTTYNFEPAAAVPEPITMSIFGAGLVGAAALRKRARKAKDGQNKA